MIYKLKHHTANFTTVDNTYLLRNDLSWSAKGLLTYLLSLPEDWTIHIKHLKSVSKDGVHSTRTALAELEAKGYAYKQITRADNGAIVSSTFNILEFPTNSQ